MRSAAEHDISFVQRAALTAAHACSAVSPASAPGALELQPIESERIMIQRTSGMTHRLRPWVAS